MSDRQGPWGSREGQAAPPAHRREPAIRAPWPALLIALLIIGSYAAQDLSGAPEAWIPRYGFTPVALFAGTWDGLFTSLFVHGSWAHAGFNAIAALAFGAPLARLFGSRPLEVVMFFVFYFVCGVLSAIAYAALHPHSSDMLVGASGAVSGLMGASSRLLGRGPGATGLAPLISSNVIGMATGWTVVNLLMAVFGLAVVTGGAPIAWEAHLFGYAAGLLLVWPAARLLRRV